MTEVGWISVAAVVYLGGLALYLGLFHDSQTEWSDDVAIFWPFCLAVFILASPLLLMYALGRWIRG